ncbi:MAG TPA: hypothetical protein VK754_02400 [Propionibacteriaceae bacterium]|nr:hypothetical protein [Propionibacteriaceae bacterium]
MKRLLLNALLLAPARLAAQAPVPDSTARLTYRFEHPTKTPPETAMAGLPTFDAVLVSIDLQWGDSVAEITGRVREKTWALNPEVWGGSPSHDKEMYFGRIQSYLGGEPRFRILVHPARCAGCEGWREVIFFRYNDTGYFVGRPRLGRDRKP